MVPNGAAKGGLDANAAYAASQPLYDVLREGLKRVEVQRSSLTAARNIVQNLHVKIVDDQSQHDQYMRSVVTAWQSATDTYADIFQQLTEVTAAKPAEGRPAAKSYSHFKALLQSATDAKAATTRFSLGANVSADSDSSDTTSSEEDSDDSSESDSDSDESSDDNSKKSKKPTSAEKKSSTPIKNSNGKRGLSEDAVESELASKVSKGDQQDFIPLAPAEGTIKVRPGTAKNYVNGVRYSENGQELWKIGAKQPTVPYGTLGASERKAWKHEKKRQIREQKKAVQRERKDARKKKEQENARAKKAARGAKAAEAGPAANGSAVPASNGAAHNGAAHVEYEDVSAEASARLQAKEDAKNAKKDSKKRKRESTDSNMKVGDFYEDLEPVEPVEPAPVKQLAVKPPKKKSKRIEKGPDGSAADGGRKSQRGKRKKADNDDEAKPGPPKRNKLKYSKATRPGKFKRGANTASATGANMTAVKSRV